MSSIESEGSPQPQQKAEHIPDPDAIKKNEQEKREYLLNLRKQQKSEPQTVREEPMPAEPEHPVASEISPQEADKEAAVQKKTGATFPMPSLRPQPPQKIKKEGNVVVAEALAEQLGTAPELKAQMRIDERKMGVFTTTEVPALAHFSYRYVYDEIRYWGHIVEWQLTGSQGVGGLARKHILQALANTSGVQSVEKAKKPNVIARQLWDRNWRQNAEQEGKIVED